MEVMAFDVPVLATKITWLMMESITPPWHWMLMKICLVVFYAFLIAVLTSNLAIHYSEESEVWLSAACRLISADWSNNIWNVTAAVFFSLLFFPVLFLCLRCDEWTQGQNGVYPLISPASPDKRNAHSRWHYFGVCTQHATTAFISCELKFTTYPLTGGVNISKMTQAVIFCCKQKKTCLSLSDPWQSQRKQQTKHSLFVFRML